MKKLSIAFLVFNEEGNIKGLVERSISQLDKMPYEYEILIVDNASTDNTGPITDELAGTHPAVEVIHHPSNLGYAMSTLTGFKKSSGDIVFIIDGDGQHTVADVPAFVDKIESGYDILFGWKVKRNDPALRIILTRFLSILAKLILDYPFNDINCGFRAVTRDVADRIEIHHKLNAAGPEIFVWGMRHNCKMAELPVRHFPRETGSSIHIPLTLPRTIGRMVGYLLQLRKELYSREKE
ncbi:MAG: glycosyltransferase family 2 protein [Nitrospiraceae bacterium]|nr:MAG: glycosyltransferase family 2 protein [Nitrospiraceae bacterium]